MNIQAEKLEIMKMILETDNPSILESIKRLFTRESSKDFWAELPQEQKDEILIGLQEIDNGDTVNYDDFMKPHKK
ncbi:MAG: hypothetical protein KDC79_13110 [Cyclobacteriaceae bacterium]|nr:hypothetical protein [Cyclobacteriaceae bacterium]